MAKVLYFINANNIAFCTQCNAVVEYDKNDVRNWTDSDGPGGCGRYYEYIYCPNCDSSIELDQ